MNKVFNSKSHEEIIKYWKNREFFDENSEIDIPNYKDKEFYLKEIVPILIEKGAIPKDKLKIDCWYLGYCRNSNKAKWNGNQFVYTIHKFSGSYEKELDHFDSDACYDVFVPIKEIEI